MARILVSEEIADGGLDRLRAAGHTVDVQLDLTPETLPAALKGAHALIIRSATQVTAEALEFADELIDLLFRTHIDASRRFIEEENIGIAI